MNENPLFCIVRINDGYCGWDHDVTETVIGVYKTKEEAENNLPENHRSYAGGDNYRSYYNHVTYKVEPYYSPTKKQICE